MAEGKENNTEPTKETPTITAGDLNLMVNIIDAGSQRGAWRGEELSTVGNLRTKLKEVLALVAPQMAEQAEAKQEPEKEATEEETKAANNG